MRTNLTSERMMKPLSLRDDTLEMEELELKGQETENKKNPRPKNGLSRLTLVHFACSVLYFTCRYHWPNGVVPYVIDAAFTTTERASIAEGITHIHENSCVRYSGGDQDCIYLICPGSKKETTRRTTWRSYLGAEAVTPSSPIGEPILHLPPLQPPARPGQGRHEVGLEQNGCVTMKIVVHELLHAIGIKHEQSRSN